MAVGRARDERTMRNGLVPVPERVLGVVWKDFGTKGCCSDMYCLFLSLSFMLKRWPPEVCVPLPRRSLCVTNS